MKALWLIVGIIILIGVVFLLQDNSGVEYIDDEQMEEVMDDGVEMMEEDDGAMMDDGESMGMPAGDKGSSEVDEMIVEEIDDSSGAAGTMPEGTEGDWTDTPTDGGNELEPIDSTDEAMGSVKEFTIDSFSFGYSMEVIRVKEGDTVTINLTNSGGFHDWVVDEFDAATEKISEGGETSVTFVADKAGNYEYYCSVGQHRANGMVGTLIVE